MLEPVSCQWHITEKISPMLHAFYRGTVLLADTPPYCCLVLEPSFEELHHEGSYFQHRLGSA